MVLDPRLRFALLLDFTMDFALSVSTTICGLEPFLAAVDSTACVRPRINDHRGKQSSSEGPDCQLAALPALMGVPKQCPLEILMLKLESIARFMIY